MGAFVGTINKIEEVGLENLVYAYVKNFKSLVPRTSYTVGDQVVFIEPDSVLPDADWAVTYKKYAPKRVKPIKLRGFLTEGIIMPISEIEQGFDFEDDTDVSGLLDITHYEPSVPSEENAIGRLPYWLPKTDEIRWEHLPLDAIVGKDRLVTLKIDGSSTTYVFERGAEDVKIYSRSLEYPHDGTSNYSRVLGTILSSGTSLYVTLEEHALNAFERDATIDAVVFRGEIHGANIQKRGKNPHADGPLSWKCYGTYVYVNAELVKQELDSYTSISVPMQSMDVDEDFINGVMEGAALKFAGLDTYEGVVINFPEYYYKGRMVSSCKVINKVYDSKI